MTEIRAGRYTLRVATDTSTPRRGSAAPREVTMAASGTVLDGLDFVLDDGP